LELQLPIHTNAFPNTRTLTKSSRTNSAAKITQSSQRFLYQQQRQRKHDTQNVPIELRNKNIKYEKDSSVLQKVSDPENTKNMSNMATKFIAFSIPTIVLLSLAMNGDEFHFMQTQGIPTGEILIIEELEEVLEESVERLESLGSTILDAAIPQDPTSVLSVALGDASAGILGAIVTQFVNTIGMNKSTSSIIDKDFSIDQENDITEYKYNLSTQNWWIQRQGNQSTDNVIFSRRTKTTMEYTDGVADSDFFLTKAAATPLIGAVGITGGVASVATILLAFVPYQFIKMTAQMKEQRTKEERYLDALLAEEKKRKKKSLPSMSPLFKTKSQDSVSIINDSNNVSPPPDAGYRFDLIALFADITKWLEYDVLKTDLGGKLTWFNTDITVNPTVESAYFGFVAALSAQIYADVIYRFSDDLGSKVKREEVKTRSFPGFIKLYTVKSFSAATLFGVYETARKPITNVILNFLSGGIDGCLGSNDFNLCLETYFVDNPAEADAGAKLRSLAVTTVNVYDRFSGVFSNVSADIVNTNVDTPELIRSWAVQLYSLIGQF